MLAVVRRLAELRGSAFQDGGAFQDLYDRGPWEYTVSPWERLSELDLTFSSGVDTRSRSSDPIWRSRTESRPIAWSRRISLMLKPTNS